MGGMSTPASTEKPGDIKFHAVNAIPPDWLKANGAAVSRTAYAALFAAIGTTYGAGDGSTTFTLPDLRGEFLRGFDDGRGADSGRVFGTAQLDGFKSHTHAGSMGAAAYSGGAAGTIVGPGPIDSGANGGAETRPRNVAMLACIKF